jgi:KDO2-lipid IV(A) lauroyltransferase
VNDLVKQIKNLRVSLTGQIIYYCLPYRKAVVMANINQVYGDKLDMAEKIRLAKAFYSHFATSIKELIQLRFMTEKQLKDRVEIIGCQRLVDQAEKGKGALVLTGHFGSWEFAPIGAMLKLKEFKGRLHFIRRTLGSKTLERILFRRYYEAGLHVIPKKNALSRVRSVLDNNGGVVFVLDQHASLANRDGVAVEFFGKKAGTYRSLATFARHTGVPVIPAAGYRLPDGRHVLELFEPIPWVDYGSNEESIYRNTLAYNQALERIILAHPEQWMWFHKRWKL